MSDEEGGDAESKRLRMLSFRVDEKTLEALDILVAATGADTLRNRRSAAIRNAIIEVAERLRGADRRSPARKK